MLDQEAVKSLQSTASPSVANDQAIDASAHSDAAARSAAQAHEEVGAMQEEAVWAPPTTKTETKLAGTYGEYTVKCGFIYDSGDWSYETEITMHANEKAKAANRIGWVQVVRRSKGALAGWGTSATDQGMTRERQKRTDQKTGWRVDRVSAPEKKTPFYGMSKQADKSLTAASNTKVGKYGGDDAYLYDAPGLYDKDEVQFLSVATDMDTGAQYDAISWGAKYDATGKVAIGETPKIIKAGDDRMAGGDAAINLWNNKVAGGDIDKVPTLQDPADTAQNAMVALTSGGGGGGTVAKLVSDKNRLEKLRTSLGSVSDPNVRARVKAVYRTQTGREIADDLRAQLSGDDLKEFQAWL
jgi:hypothetical protein